MNSTHFHQYKLSNSSFKMKTYFATLTFVLFGGISVATALQCDLAETCTDGNLLKIVDAQNSKDCLAICKELENCGYFTFFNDFPAANCQLYENCYETSSCDNCISGEVSCHNFSCQLPGLCLVCLNVSNYTIFTT